jgi:toxin ParE1/3/4
MKKYDVVVDRDAEEDLFDLYRYIALYDSVVQADRLISSLTRLCESLRYLPLRGRIPPELQSIGVSEFREVRYKPYRVFYSTDGHAVFIHCVLDGRRDMQTLLQERLIR